MTSERWEQIGRLYEAASQLKSGARASFLDHACEGDGELRREVESLLAAEASVGDFIAAPALRDAAALLSTASPDEMIGKQLGHYQIVSFLGAGGMGEVYAAKDSRIGRKVAIKLLPAAVSRDADRLRRFEQEARAIGMLNHPNILTIHDIGLHEASPYIVSELLEGETLRERIKSGPIAPRKAADFALQIARGLAAAHERGVVHRDLKPENLFLTRDERIKILDFGLAKLAQPASGLSNASAPVAMQTEPGKVMGTVGYMSPEQVRGEEADSRADIFAFGVILYEMFAGQRPFRGDTAIETMNAILKTDAPALPAPFAEESPGLDRVIHRCLEKRTEQRFQSASDLAFALEALTGTASRPITATGSATLPLHAVGQPMNRLGRLGRLSLLGLLGLLGWIVAGVALLAAITLASRWGAWSRRPDAKPAAIRLSVAPPEKAVRMADPAISPDGRRLAFVAFADGKSQMWLRPLSSLTAQPMSGTEGAASPFWSPDSRSIGFFAQGKLKTIALSGEAPVTLCDAPSSRGGGAWNRDGVILFVPHPNAGVHRVASSGGAAAPVMTPDAGREESSHLSPRFLPDGRHFLYLVTGAQPDDAGVYVASLDGRVRQRILSGASNAVYAPPGYLLFQREGALLAQAFDASTRKLTGEPVRLADQVDGGPFGGGFSVSRDGVLVYSPNPITGNQQLAWFDRAGKPLGPIGAPGAFLGASLSPDETQVAIARPDRQTRTPDLWLLDLARGTDLRFTSDPANDFFPLWSPDGSALAWVSTREGLSGLYRKPANGSGADELLFRSGHQKRPTDWADWAGGTRFLLFQDNDPKTKWDLWALPMEGARNPIPLVRTSFNETNGRVSPDGRWIAWASDESGRNEIYAQAFRPGETSGGRRRVSTEGGDNPRWRRDGRELFFAAPDGKLFSVVVSGAKDFTAGEPRELFNLRALKAAGGSYAVSNDGRKFLLAHNVEDLSAAPFTIVLDWTADLKP